MAQLLRKQSGTFSLLTGDTFESIAVSTYSPARSFLVFTMRGGNANPGDSLVKALKATTTSITFQRQAASASDLFISWELFEFGELVTVQDVTFTVDGSTAINAVTLARSFIISCGYFNAGTTQSGDDMVGFSFNSSTSARHHMEGGGQSVDGGMFQVVDYQGCSVQSFTNTIAAATTTWNQGINSSPTNRTILWASCYYDGGTTQLQFTNVFRIGMTSAVNVQGNRATAGAFTQDVTVFACLMADWTVQRGNQTNVGSDSTDDVALTAVTLNRTMSHCVAQHGAGPQSFCESTATGDSYDEVMYTAILTSTTNLRLQRTNTAPTNNIQWEVCEWFGGYGGAQTFMNPGM